MIPSAGQGPAHGEVCRPRDSARAAVLLESPGRHATARRQSVLRAGWNSPPAVMATCSHEPASACDAPCVAGSADLV